MSSIALMTQIPDFVTHYNRSEPFLSLTSVSREKRTEVLSGLNSTNTWGLDRFLDPNYLDRRIEVEDKIRNEFLDLGGKPELERPIYFFLGRSSSFEKYSSNKAYSILLKDLPENVISFTYGDSLLAYDDSYRAQVGEAYRNQLCKQLFLAGNLSELFFSEHFPKENALHIEAQLWIKPSLGIVRG